MVVTRECFIEAHSMDLTANSQRIGSVMVLRMCFFCWPFSVTYLYMKNTVLPLLVLIVITSMAGCGDTQTHLGTPSTPHGPALPPPAGGDGESRSAVVTEVIDGDTVGVEFSNGMTDTVRLIGVDTPETNPANEATADFNVPDTAKGRDWLLNWGEKAKTHAQNELEGEEVEIVTDPNADTRGSYGRLLAYVYVDSENFNHELIAQGFARRYDDSQFTYHEEFGNAE